MANSSISNVLIFDSGVGGLSVFQEIKAFLPNLNYTYVFDNAAYPYGELPPETLKRRVLEIVIQHVALHDIDLVVIACNTASTLVLPDLREQLSISVVGVVPAIKPASIQANRSVALIATPATVKREYTQELIDNFSGGKTIEMLGLTRMVDIAEEKLRGKAVDLNELSDLLAPINTHHIDVAVLGCTHFPLVKEEIQAVLGGDVILIDSGNAIARRVKELLQSREKKQDCATDSQGSVKRHAIFSTAPPWQAEVLNETLSDLGFSPVTVCPILGA